MSYRVMGAVLIFAGCGGFGFSIAANYKTREKLLRQLCCILDYMECELQYQLTPLPELCRHSVRNCRGILRDVFLNLSRELDWQTSPDAGSCMAAALRKSPNLPGELRKYLMHLGHTLGRFDLPGQLQGIKAVKQMCRAELKRLGRDRNSRLRSYQTLGLCAGAALAILFL